MASPRYKLITRLTGISTKARTGFNIVNRPRAVRVGRIMLFPCRNTPPCIATILTWAKSGRNTAKCFLLQLNVSKYKQNNRRRIRAVSCLYNDVKRSHIRPVLTVLRSESPCALSLSLARPLARPLALNKRHITPAFVVHTIWH